MLKILIVEDEQLLATTIKYLVELNPRYQVTAIADDLDSALEAIEERRPDLALVDLQLARGSTGFNVAAKLHERGVACLFTTGNAPPFPIPDLALGCLSKPIREEDLVRALKAAEDILNGRERHRPSLPESLQLYPPPPEEERPPRTDPLLAMAAFAKPARKSRLRRWLAA